MQFSRLVLCILCLLAPAAILSTAWLYAYPPLHGCGFARPRNSTTPAPFRLLALGDPQLEGDSSLPKRGARVVPSLGVLWGDVRSAGGWGARWDVLRIGVGGLWEDGVRGVKGCRKRVDLWGNDYYLGHVVRMTRWWTQPTHVAVLGDLLGSQWVSDEEFGRRAGRYWGRVFRGMERVPDDIMGGAGTEEEGDEGDVGDEQRGEKQSWGGTTEILGQDERWSNRVINIAGNHDIGYAGDLDEHRIARFERAFGRVNWDIWFTLPPTTNSTPSPPTLRLITLNSMNLDTPALSPALQTTTYTYLNHLITTSHPVSLAHHTTLLLTHIPLHKRAGICYDSPFFTFFPAAPEGVKEQNMLSPHASRAILEGVFGLSGEGGKEGGGRGRAGAVLDGHDHEGCDVLHYILRRGDKEECGGRLAEDEEEGEGGEEGEGDEPRWQAMRLPSSPSRPREPVYEIGGKEAPCVLGEQTPRMREVTLRSVMGEFGGYAGFVSAWFEEERGEWRIEFGTCGLGVQHWWWAVHVLDAVVVVGGAVLGKKSGDDEGVEKGKGKGKGVKTPMEKTKRVGAMPQPGEPSKKKG
ncbi:hypothetical protein EJ04DRAFT_546377 [Polyplosphaeria fusca]|uniref:Calcineurin-like phosphoesterase domain-containing protein n=1 Tax=Polyplosphaeria fusca TaxID=682080 RepID=A0A9P4QL23_9PLEO|nr:hypothetical protein EJ04DRAFT_546377 [Polyplosphaeria fusca]